MKVYIAGPMTGIPDYNYPAFHAAEAEWALAGWEVKNPARNFSGDQSLPYETYIKQALADVFDSDAVAVLPGWQHSNGARAELQLALTLDKPIYRADGPGSPDGPFLVGKFFVRQALAESIESCAEKEAGAAPPKATIPSAIIEAVELRAAAREARKVHAFAPRIGSIPVYAPPPGEFVDAVMAAPEVHDYTGTTDGGGYKGSMDDPKKLPMWLVPNALIEAAARSLQHGARKYAPNNWRRGMDFSEVYSALQRHMLAWLEREDADPDSGLSHLDHAAACLAFLCEYEARPEYAKFDNRLKRQRETA